ncbi:MAG: rhodanese-like domain-containing protein [Lentisphaeraceae bacterium]|nr:rhodanese-like domain-containing protein [Lentisphaeraceae bacterium]
MAKPFILFCLIFCLPAIPSLLLRSSFEQENKLHLQKQDKLSVDVQTALTFKNILWLDARSKNKYEKDHVPEALYVSFADWEASLAQIFERYSDDQVIIVYCNEECSTSKNIASQLRQELGNDRIYYLIGGFDAWQSR